MGASRKKLTYEELARKYDITPNKVNTIVKSAYNKIVQTLLENENVNIFDVVLALREYFNMTETEAFEKLNDDHQELLRQYAINEYNIKESEENSVRSKKKRIKKKVDDTEDFESLFRY